MAKDFDATLRHLIEAFPQHWPALVGVAVRGKVTVLNVNLSAVSPEADVLLLIDDPDGPWILHIEIQTSHDDDVPRRMHLYNTLAHHHRRLPVRSVLLLLRRSADGSDYTGVYVRPMPGLSEPLRFPYQVVRLWTLPAGSLLEAGLGVAPLALVTDDAQPRLRELVSRIEERLAREATPEQADFVRLCERILMGLRYTADAVKAIMTGVRNMKDSTTYQEIVQEGFVKGLTEGRREGREAARRLLLRIGTARLGPPDAATRKRIEALTDFAELERLADLALSATAWSEICPSND